MEKEKTNEITEVIKEAIAKIPNDNYRVAVQLKVDGFKLEEIAQIVDKSAVAVKNDYKRGKQELRDNLTQMGYLKK